VHFYATFRPFLISPHLRSTGSPSPPAQRRQCRPGTTTSRHGASVAVLPRVTPRTQRAGVISHLAKDAEPGMAIASRLLLKSAAVARGFWIDMWFSRKIKLRIHRRSDVHPGASTQNISFASSQN